LHGPQYFESIDLGQHQIEDHRRIAGISEKPDGFLAVMRDFHAEERRQALLEHLGQDAGILHDEDDGLFRVGHGFLGLLGPIRSLDEGGKGSTAFYDTETGRAKR
jgi:hypothetical protein